MALLLQNLPIVTYFLYHGIQKCLPLKWLWVMWKPEIARAVAGIDAEGAAINNLVRIL